MNDKPSDSPCDDAVVAFEQYQKARSRYRGVIDFGRHKRAQQQLGLDLANAFRSADAGKYDPTDDGAA